jgi:hypothetical protein
LIKSYLDNRIRFHLNGIIYNIHVLAIPMFDRHTGENMFNLVDKFLNIICPNWRVKLIGVGSDRANSMTGHLKGVVTRLEQEAVFKMYQTWCGLHQLDLVMHRAYENLMDGEVLTILNAFIAHLRQQANLIADMQATCPKLSNRWVIMGKVCKWLLAKRICLFQYITDAAPPHCPPFWWWIIIAAIDALTEQVNIVFTKLQAKDLLVSQQTAELVNLASLICIQVRVDGPHSAEELDALDTSTTFTSSHWSVSNYNIVRYFFLNYANIRFLFDQGIYIRDLFKELEPERQFQVISTIGRLVLDIVEGILAIQAERDSRNDASDALPPTLPHELAKIRGSAFGEILLAHVDHLRQFWSEESIADIEDQHKKLVRAYQNEPILQSKLDKCDHNTSFEAGWRIVEGRFDVLRDFCGGIATIFANTASVESDFSILGWEKDEYLMSLTDLSLEGVMQCKQFELLSKLAKICANK